MSTRDTPTYRVQVAKLGHPIAFYPADPVWPDELLDPDYVIPVTKDVYEDVKKNRHTRRWNGDAFVHCEEYSFHGMVSEDDIFKHTYAFGRFMHFFADVESQIFTLLSFILKLDLEISKAVFSGAKTDLLLQHISRIHEIKNEPIPQELDRIAPQLSAINDVRNKLVHYGVRIESGDLITWNTRALRTREQTKYSCSALDLTDMTVDLKTITACITRYRFAGLAPEEDPVMREIRRRALAPWRYTRPQPPPQQNPQSRTPKERPAQDGASPGSPRECGVKKLSSAQKRKLKEGQSSEGNETE